jgi:uncharacterized repeat protein (TIGR01451 family)
MQKTGVLLVLVVLIVFPINHLSSAAPNSVVVPGEIRADATFEHIGVLWWIEGDQDLDSRMSIEFRRLGEGKWHPGAPAARAYPTLLIDGEPLGLNYWAASALFLNPGDTYELRLTLTDPDGGGVTRTITAATRTEPMPDPSGRDLHVVPGNGGGDGTQANPFRGLQAAADAAQPGDVFHIGPGIYNSFEVETSGVEGHPISFLGPGDGTAVVEGGGTDRGIVTLGSSGQTIGHIIIEGLTMQNGNWGIDAQRSHDIVIRRNHIRDVDDGIANRRKNADEHNQTVCDNVIEGRSPYPGSGVPVGAGIDLRGYGNVVCHNRLRYFSDCILVQPYTGPSYGNDVVGNDVSYCDDDGIEMDYNQANARVWRNRVMNSRVGASFQTIRGGPVYIFRNQLYNPETVPIKMYNTTGLIVAHNTGATNGNGYGDNGAMWRNVVLRNNLFLGTRYAFEFRTTPGEDDVRDFDFNAWGTTREISPGDPFFKWNGDRYDTLADLPSGVEDHGVEASFGDLVNGNLPATWDVIVEPDSRDLRLVAGAPAINAGTDLPNLNDGFALSGAPDAGAFEYGQPLPHYGPRARVPDLSASQKHASHPAAKSGETVIYTVVIRNTGAALDHTVLVTDTVPAGLSYVDDSLTATLGTTDDSRAPILRWSGELGATPAVTIKYAATVTEESARLITNVAVINGGASGTIVRSAAILANGSNQFLPVVAKHHMHR